MKDDVTRELAFVTGQLMGLLSRKNDDELQQYLLKRDYSPEDEAALMKELKKLAQVFYR